MARGRYTIRSQRPAAPQRKQNRAPRFDFEAGEQSLPLTVKVTSVTLATSETSKEVTLRTLDGEPEHLRVLGQRVTVTSPNKDVSFVVGPDVKKAHSYAVADGDDAPKVTVVGPPGTNFALVYKGSAKYKHS